MLFKKNEILEPLTLNSGIPMGKAHIQKHPKTFVAFPNAEKTSSFRQEGTCRKASLAFSKASTSKAAVSFGHFFFTRKNELWY